MRWLNYQHLYYFWNVARYGSVTEAGQRLRLAQPTISAQLKIFEDMLGERLFFREGRNLKLTETGKLAYKYAENIFSLGDEFMRVLDGTTPKTPDEVRVGIADVVPKLIGFRLIEPLFSSGSRVICHEDRSERLLAELSISEVDLVISDSPIPASVKVKAFNHYLGDCSMSFLASGKLAKRYKPGFPNSLKGAPLLLPAREAAVRREIDQWISNLSLPPVVVGEFQDSALMKIVAREGMGIVPVPTFVEREVCKEFNLLVLGRIDSIRERLYLISVERRIKNPLVKLVCDGAARRLVKTKP